MIINDYKYTIKYIGLLYQGFMKQYLKKICEYSHKKREEYDKIINSYKSDDNKGEREGFFSNNLRNGVRSVHNRNKDMNILFKESNMNENNGDYDGKEKEKDINKILEDKINDILEIVYLELGIYYCYNLFVNYCEKVVQKIVYHLGTFNNVEDITKTGKLHPIVFPNPSNFTQITNDNKEKQNDNSEPVLLYSIWGVNYTLTWNSLTAKFGDTVGTSGKWKKIKHQFQQKNYFQDFLIKLATVADKTDEFPNIPVSCIIDYNGFRVYCESDIFVSEEYLEGMRLQINKNDISFIKNIMQLISVDNNEETKKIETSDIFCKIKYKYIAEEKGFELEQYIKKMIEDYLKTFEKENQSVDKEFNPFTDMQSQKPIINCIKKLITEDKNIMISPIEHFDAFKKNSIDLQQKYTFQYLMYFDVLIPKESKANRNETIFYRQEIALNNINIKEELKQLAPKYKKSNYLNENRNDDYQFEEGYKNSSSSHGNHSNINNNQNLRINTRNIQLTKQKEGEKKKLKSPEEIIIDIITKNIYQNNKKIVFDLKKKFNQNLENLLMAFDSLYLIPYNSETLKICFHYYGINLHYLGKVAERTTVPHIREICVIEMFARVCKKIIFDLLGQETYKNAMEVFYSDIKELTTKLHCVPVSLNVMYGSDYLKSITQPLERGKCYYKNMEITGLYMNSEEYPLENKDGKQNKNSNKPNYIQIKNTKVNNFLTLLFGGMITKSDLTINGVEIKKVEELWELIKDLMRKQYDITNEDVFMYCDLDTISFNALGSAIQYHTGLQIQNEINQLKEKVQTQKLENSIFENITLLPKKSYYSFTYFLCKENVILPLTNNFAMYFPEKSKYYRAKLNYFSEKYLYKKKISQNYYYLKYLKILKGWDLGKNPKAVRTQQKNEEFYIDINNNEYTRAKSPIFEENFDSFISLLMTQYQEKSQSHKNDNKDNNQSKEDLSLFATCRDNIIENWKNKKHPYVSLLNSTYAKALYKNTGNRKDDAKIEKYFNDSIEIARDSMGELNLFFGKLTRDVGLFYEKNFKFKEAYEMFYLSYQVFKKYQKIFKKDYFYSLKNLTKTCVYLGRLGEALKYGLILVEEITKDSHQKLTDPLKVQDYTPILDNEKKESAWDKIHNMNGFTFNLMKVAEYLHEYDLCVKIGNIFFSRIKDYSAFKITEFKNWLITSQKRMISLSNLRNNQNNKGEAKPNRQIRIEEEGGENITIDHVIFCYLKCLFRGLKGIQNKTFARACVAFIEKCNNAELSHLNNEQIRALFYNLFFRNTNETFDQYFKNKILYFLLQKYKKENLNKEEIEQRYLSARRDLEIIYYKFKENAAELFMSYNIKKRK
jgi:hypothetical protein